MPAEHQSPPPAVAAAAAALGVDPDEIAATEPTALGLVVRTRSDGAEYIVVPEDNPDAEGKTGVMARWPSASKFGASIPVYATATPAGPGDTPTQPSPPYRPLEALRAPLVEDVPAIDEIGDDPVALRRAIAALESERATAADAPAPVSIGEGRAARDRLAALDADLALLRAALPRAEAAERRRGFERAEQREREAALRQARAVIAAAPVLDRLRAIADELEPTRAAAAPGGGLRAIGLLDRLVAYLEGPWATEVLPEARALVERAGGAATADGPAPSRRRRLRARA